MPSTRRTFLERLLALAAAGSAHSASWALAENPRDGETGLPIVDTHQHLWDLEKLRLPWLDNAGKLNRNHLLDDYQEAARELNIQKAVYMEVAVAEEDLRREAELVIALCQSGRSPTVAAVIGGRPGKPGFADYLRPFSRSPYIKGVRHIPPGGEAGRALWQSRAFRDDIRRLGDWGLCFDICVPPEMLDLAADVVCECPGTRFVLDHCGNADPRQFPPFLTEDTPAARDYRKTWQAGVERLAAEENVVCKISGIVARMPPDEWRPEHLAPVINCCLSAFGPNRVMFASDWPVCTRAATLQEWVAALKVTVADRSTAQRRKLFHDNAVRFYGLE